MATKTSSTEIIQQKEVFVKSNEVLKEMERAGQLEPYTKYYTPDDDVNFSCLRTEVVYDMSSSDANKNWGYKTGIMSPSVISGKNFSKYEKLIIYAQFAGQASGTGILDLSKTLDSAGTYRTKLAFGSEEDTDVYTCFVRVSADKTEFANGQMGYISGGSFTSRNSYSSYYIYKIEGVLKTPAMIYTGAELHEGNGISIDNGVISEKSKVLFDGNFSITDGAKLTLDLAIPEYAKVLVFVLVESNTSRSVPMVIDLSKTKGSYWGGHAQSSNGNTFIKSCDWTRSGNTFTFSGLKESTNFGSRNSVTNLYTQITKAVVLW